MPNTVPSHLLNLNRDIGEIIESRMNLLLAIGKDSVFMAWDGCIPWTDDAGNELPGIIGQIRREGKPYEYERGEVKAFGYDTFVIVRDSDVHGRLKNQDIVTITSRENPDEPPMQFKVRFIDAMADTNAVVYLMDIDEVEQEPEPDPDPDGRRHWSRNRNLRRVRF